ncbi:MAG: TnpV protein [Clostridia bacterium]|nr:TnpV protein [Clostridia bacterium]
MNKWEQMDGTSCQEGEYLLPNLSLPSGTEEYRIGKYSRMRQRYLKEHRHVLHAILTLEETLIEHLAEVARSRNNRHESIEKTMMEQESVTEALKTSDQAVSLIFVQPLSFA